MARGKQTCKILKEIRKQIAAENDIELVVSECTYQGDCLGTCPKCEAEVRYLERELEKRQRLGKAAVFAGMTLGTAITAASCGPLVQPTAGMPMNPNDTIVAMDTVRKDSVDEPYLLEGDVMKTLPDTLKEEEEKKKASCKSDVLSAIPGEVVEIDTTEIIEGELPGFERKHIAPEVGEVSPDDMIDEVYTIVEQMPEFPGGKEAMEKYIKDNIKIGETVSKWQADAWGRIFVNFIVEPDGSLTNVKVLQGICEPYDEEAVRVVKSMPNWKPGMQRGKPVRVSYTIPIVWWWG